VNSAWRFGIGGEQQVNKTTKWGVAGELLYGGTLDVNRRSVLPPVGAAIWSARTAAPPR